VKAHVRTLSDERGPGITHGVGEVLVVVECKTECEGGEVVCVGARNVRQALQQSHVLFGDELAHCRVRGEDCQPEPGDTLDVAVLVGGLRGRD